MTNSAVTDTKIIDIGVDSIGRSIRRRARRPALTADGNYSATLSNGAQVIVSASRKHLVDGVNWCWTNGYASRIDRRTPKHSKVTSRLHRIIAAEIIGRDLLPSETVDHINHDRLDCRDENLRVISPADNSGNRSTYATSKSGVDGVSWQDDEAAWFARVTHQGKRYFLGLFDDIATAKAARCVASCVIRGEYARTDHKDEFDLSMNVVAEYLKAPSRTPNKNLLSFFEKAKGGT